MNIQIINIWEDFILHERNFIMLNNLTFSF